MGFLTDNLSTALQRQRMIFRDLTPYYRILINLGKVLITWMRGVNSYAPEGRVRRSKREPALTSLAKLRQKLLTDPKVKAEYDRLGPVFAGAAYRGKGQKFDRNP
jgi:hypothetical protein